MLALALFVCASMLSRIALSARVTFRSERLQNHSAKDLLNEKAYLIPFDKHVQWGFRDGSLKPGIDLEIKTSVDAIISSFNSTESPDLRVKICPHVASRGCTSGIPSWCASLGRKGYKHTIERSSGFKNKLAELFPGTLVGLPQAHFAYESAGGRKLTATAAATAYSMVILKAYDAEAPDCSFKDFYSFVSIPKTEEEGEHEANGDPLQEATGEGGAEQEDLELDEEEG